MPAPVNYGQEAQKSLINELDPRKEIPRICEELLGIFTNIDTETGKRVITVKRSSRPLFAEEFVSLVKHTLFGYVNNVNSFTKYDDNAISFRMKNIRREIHLLFATHGNDYYISEKTWQQILKIHDSGDNIQNNEKTQKISGWVKFGIDWKYDNPVTNEMVSYVKDYQENNDQEIIFTMTTGMIGRLIDSNFRRSMIMPDNYGMMASLLNNTRDESYNGAVGSQMPLPQGNPWGNG